MADASSRSTRLGTVRSPSNSIHWGGRSTGVLVTRPLDMSEELAALANEVQAPAQQAPGRLHGGRVGVLLWQHPARRSVAMGRANALREQNPG